MVKNFTSSIFSVILLTDRQTNKQTNTGINMYLLLCRRYNRYYYKATARNDDVSDASSSKKIDDADSVID